MKLNRKSIAGSLQSNDCLVSIFPSDEIKLTLTSPVENQFGERIRKVIYETLSHLGVEGCDITVEDKGALNFTIRSRVETAVKRAYV